jgi:excisionase family DNA binding protein
LLAAPDSWVKAGRTCSVWTPNTTRRGSPWGLEPLLDVGELAAYLGVPVFTVYDWCARGSGPRACRFGKHLEFALSDVQIWIEQQRDPEPPAPADGR